MHALQRHRSGERGIAEVAGAFLQAIENAVNAPGEDRRRIASSVFRLDALLLDRLDELQRQPERRDGPLLIGRSASVETGRFVQALLPEVVRHIARIEAGQCVAVLSVKD